MTAAAAQDMRHQVAQCITDAGRIKVKVKVKVKAVLRQHAVRQSVYCYWSWRRRHIVCALKSGVTIKRKRATVTLTLTQLFFPPFRFLVTPLKSTRTPVKAKLAYLNKICIEHTTCPWVACCSQRHRLSILYILCFHICTVIATYEFCCSAMKSYTVTVNIAVQWAYCSDYRQRRFSVCFYVYGDAKNTEYHKTFHELDGVSTLDGQLNKYSEIKQKDINRRIIWMFSVTGERRSGVAIRPAIS